MDSFAESTYEHSTGGDGRTSEASKRESWRRSKPPHPLTETLHANDGSDDYSDKTDQTKDELVVGLDVHKDSPIDRRRGNDTEMSDNIHVLGTHNVIDSRASDNAIP